MKNIEHSAAGTTWKKKNHKYKYIADGRYVYDDGTSDSTYSDVKYNVLRKPPEGMSTEQILSIRRYDNGTPNDPSDDKYYRGGTAYNNRTNHQVSFEHEMDYEYVQRSVSSLFSSKYTTINQATEKYKGAVRVVKEVGVLERAYNDIVNYATKAAKAVKKFFNKLFK